MCVHLHVCGSLAKVSKKENYRLSVLYFNYYLLLFSNNNWRYHYASDIFPRCLIFPLFGHTVIWWTSIKLLKIELKIANPSIAYNCLLLQKLLKWTNDLRDIFTMECSNKTSSLERNGLVYQPQWFSSWTLMSTDRFWASHPFFKGCSHHAATPVRFRVYYYPSSWAQCS